MDVWLALTPSAPVIKLSLMLLQATISSFAALATRCEKLAPPVPPRSIPLSRRVKVSMSLLLKFSRLFRLFVLRLLLKTDLRFPLSPTPLMTFPHAHPLRGPFILLP